jgi:hypothetical protein
VPGLEAPDRGNSGCDLAMSEPRGRAQVVLLAGLPHGGTTITNILLGQHPAVFSAGDLERFPDKQLNHLCSCGEPAAECPFWLEIRRRFAAFAGRDELRRMAFLYDTICQQSGSRYVVDVCHDVERTKELVKNPYVDFQADSSDQGRQRSRPFQIAARLRKRPAYRLRMAAFREDIAHDPQMATTFLDLDYGRVQRDLIKGRPLLQVPHLVRGKPALRRKKVRQVMLTHDVRYVREMAVVDRCLFHLLGGRVGRAHLFRG